MARHVRIATRCAVITRKATPAAIQGSRSHVQSVGEGSSDRGSYLQSGPSYLEEDPGVTGADPPRAPQRNWCRFTGGRWTRGPRPAYRENCYRKFQIYRSRVSGRRLREFWPPVGFKRTACPTDSDHQGVRYTSTISTSVSEFFSCIKFRGTSNGDFIQGIVVKTGRLLLVRITKNFYGPCVCELKKNIHIAKIWTKCTEKVRTNSRERWSGWRSVMCATYAISR